jgi:glycosyltransferase involved in cell wall biosynthesis
MITNLPSDHLLRIMILSTEYPPVTHQGGLGTHVYELAQGLSRLGCQVTILAYTPNTPTKLHQSNCVVHFLSPVDSCPETIQPSLVQRILTFNDDLVRQGKTLISENNQRPHIIHFHDWFTFSAAHALGQMFDIPVVGTIHMLQEPIVRYWGITPNEEVVQVEKELFQRADLLITVSQSLRQIIQTTHQTPDHQIRVIYNGMNPQPFVNPSLSPSAINKLRRTITQTNEKIILYAGRLNPQKGILALIDSASLVIEQFSNVCYLIVGEIDSLEFLQTIRNRLQLYPVLAGKVKMLGKLSRKKLATLYKIADIAVVPSIYEPFGYAALEAMAAGVPVVASCIGGLTEILQHGQSGVLVPVHLHDSGMYLVDVEKLASAQLQLLQNEAMARQIGKRGQQHVLNTFNLEDMVQATLQVYKEVVLTLPG